MSPLEKKVFLPASRFIPDSLNPFSRHISRDLAAAEALNLLGPEARPAFPTLTNLMTKRTHVIPAGIALAGMGSDGIAVLTEAVTNSDPNLRLNAATALGEARSDFDKVIPALIESAQLGGHQPLEDNLARSAAADTLVALHKEPNLVVPMFAGFLTKQDEYIRNLGVKNVLVGFGADARIAIPQLLQAETNSDPNVRESATNVIKEINSSEEKTRDEAQAGP